MTILDSTLRKLQAFSDVAAVTAEPEVVASYVDLTAGSSPLESENIVLNGTTPVDILTAPAAAVSRKLLEASVYNPDSVSHLVTIRYNDNGTIRRIARALVKPGQTMHYSPSKGWRVGDVVGASAYEIAVSNGFVGTEQDWLASLVGGSYTHTQGSASAVWTVTHNLGYKPDITVLSAGSVVIEALVTHLSNNIAQIDFDTATTGTARAE